MTPAPAPPLSSAPAAPTALRRLLDMVRAHRGLLATVVLAMAVTAGTEALLARLSGVLLDKGFYQRDAQAMLWLPLAFVGVFVLRGLTTFTANYLLGRISQFVLVDLRARMYERLLVWPQSAYETAPSGAVVTKFVNEASNALSLVAEVMTTAVRDTLTVIALLGMMLWLNWQMTLLTLVVAPVFAFILRGFGRRLRGLHRDQQVLLGEMTRAVQEAHAGARIVKVYGGAAQERARFARINDRLRAFAMKIQVPNAAATPLTQIVAAVGISVVISAALWQANAAQLSPADFVTFLSAALMLLGPLRHLAAINGPLARLSAAADSVFALVDSPGETETGTREFSGRARGAVEFVDVRFAYPGTARPALDGVTLRVQPGETIALVGPSGAGKTTLLALLPRFVGPDSGRILIDGVPIDAVTLASLRRQFALVAQDTVLFDDTIANNIAYGDTQGASRAAIRAAAEAAYLLPFIDSLPAGLDTPVGEDAVRLSGGQRQRLAIARALLKDAPILLLDEATSALDAESERHVQSSLERLMRGRTTFVVAHRLATIERADRIAVLDAGRLVEVGPHAELLARGGLYAQLHAIQFAGAVQPGGDPR